MGRWFFGCPAYQSGPGKEGFRIDLSMVSQSSSSRSLPDASRLRLLRSGWFFGYYFEVDGFSGTTSKWMVFRVLLRSGLAAGRDLEEDD